MPEKNDHKSQYKFPFNACEIWCANNNAILDRLWNASEMDLGDSHRDESEKKGEQGNGNGGGDYREGEEDGEEEEDGEDDGKGEGEEDGRKEERDSEMKMGKEEEGKDQQWEKVGVKEDENREFVVKEGEQGEQGEEGGEGEQGEQGGEGEQGEQGGDSTKQSNGVATVAIIPQNITTTPSKPNPSNQPTHHPFQTPDNATPNNPLQSPIKPIIDPKCKTTYENLDYFFAFLFDNDEDSNYVLVGYFNKILTHLITSKGPTVIKYLFESRQDCIGGLIKHLNRKGIGDCVHKILTFTDETLPNLPEKKAEFLSLIVQELCSTKDEEKCDCICELLINAIENKEFFALLLSQTSTFHLLFSILDVFSSDAGAGAGNSGTKLQVYLKLLIKINENILQYFEHLVTPMVTPEVPMDYMALMNNNYNYNQSPDEDDNTVLDTLPEDIFTSVLSFIFTSLKENEFIFLSDINDERATEEQETTYQIPLKRFGLDNWARIEFFRSVLDIMVNAYANKAQLQKQIEELIRIFKDTCLFRIWLTILLKHEFNNMYQTLFVQIVNIVVCKDSPKLWISAVFEADTSGDFASTLIEHCVTQTKFTFISSRTINSGVFSILIEIIHSVVHSNNTHVKAVVQEHRDLGVFAWIVSNRVKEMFKQKLLSSDINAFSPNLEQREDPMGPPVNAGGKPLNAIIEDYLMIYNTYKQGGNYQKLLEDKEQEEILQRDTQNKLASSIEIGGFQRDEFNDEFEQDPDEGRASGMNTPHPQDVKEEDYEDNIYWNMNSITDHQLRELDSELGLEEDAFGL